MEASSIAIAQRRLVATRFAAVGFTNLSQDHLDFHGDLEQYFATKATLFDGSLPARGQRGRLPTARGSRPSCASPSSPRCDVRCEAFELGPTHRAVRAHAARARSRSSRALRGRFNVDNVLCAVDARAAARRPPRRHRAAVAARGAARAASSRWRRASPSPWSSTTRTRRPASRRCWPRRAPLVTGRLMCVFGAGGDRDHAKRPLMGAAAEAGSDVIVGHERQPALGAAGARSASRSSRASSGPPRRSSSPTGAARSPRAVGRRRARATSS